MAKKYALLGKNIKNSLSPHIHKTLANIYNVDLEYHILESENIGIAKKHLFSGTYDGFNITMPYKVDIMESVDSIDESAKLPGSTNTLLVSDGLITAYNTDGSGFLDVLKSNNYDVKDKNILLKGAGGAARGIASELLKNGVKMIVCDTRTTESRISFFETISSIDSDKIAMIYGVNGLITDLAVNATPVGTYPNSELSINLDNLSCEAVFDLVYRPNETELIKKAKSRGIKYFCGLDMLICQGIRAFSIWYPNTVKEINLPLINKIKTELFSTGVL